SGCARKMLCPHTTGAACPFSGKSIFHLTFFVSLQVVGSFFSADVPSPLGPRQPGQLSAASAAVAEGAEIAIDMRVMGGPIFTPHFFAGSGIEIALASRGTSKTARIRALFLSLRFLDTRCRHMAGS